MTSDELLLKVRKALADFTKFPGLVPSNVLYLGKTEREAFLDLQFFRSVYVTGRGAWPELLGARIHWVDEATHVGVGAA